MIDKKEMFLKALKNRYACKEFSADKKIKDEDFNFILEAGRLSPSSFGFEPWKFLVFTKQEDREKVTRESWGGKDRAIGASHLLVVLNMVEDLKYDSEYLQNFMKNIQKLPDDIIEKKTEIFENFQKGSFALLESRRTLSDWSSKQTYIALGNMLTAGEIVGVNSCPIEGFDKIKTRAILEKEYGIDMKKYDIAYMIAFGYEKNSYTGTKSRRELKEIVKFY